MKTTIKKLTKFLFNANGRMSRKHFFIINAYGFWVMLTLLLMLLSLPNGKYFQWVRVICFFLIPIHLTIWSIVRQIAVIKRFHDLGLSGEEAWKLSIPIKGWSIGMALDFDKGQRHDNQYGPTTWTEKELLQSEPDALQKKVNQLGIKKAANFSKSTMSNWKKVHKTKRCSIK